MMDWYGSGGHMTGIGWLVMVLLVIAILGGFALVAYAVVRGTRAPDRGREDSEARHVLDERFARGEIDFDEYQRRRTLLESGRRS